MGPQGAFISPQPQTYTPKAVLHLLLEALPPRDECPPSCIFQSTLPVGWGVFSWPGRVEGRGVAPCPLRGDLGEIRVSVAVAGEGLAGRVQVAWCPRPGHRALPVGSSRKRAGNSRGRGSPRNLPLGPPGPAPGPAPKQMGFPRRVTGLPLAMPQAWYGAQPVSFNRSWAPGASEGESSERGLWAHGHGAGADGVRGSRWLGQGPGQGALGWPSRPCPWRRV